MKQTLYYDSLQNALCVQTNMKALDGIEADGPGEIDQDGYYAVSWSTDQALTSTQKGRIIRIYQPDDVAFNLIPRNNPLDEGFHGVDERCDHAQPIDEQTQVRDYRYTDDPTYGQFNL